MPLFSFHDDENTMRVDFNILEIWRRQLVPQVKFDLIKYMLPILHSDVENNAIKYLYN